MINVKNIIKNLYEILLGIKFNDTRVPNSKLTSLPAATRMRNYGIVIYLPLTLNFSNLLAPSRVSTRDECLRRQI